MTAPTIDGLPDVEDRTPEHDVIVQIPLPAWQKATSWVAGAKPRAGSDNPLDQLNLRFTGHPHHYRLDWTPDPIDVVDPAITLAVTDRYRLAYATIASNNDPDHDNQLQYLSDAHAGAVSVDASDALKAMRGWPAVALKDAEDHAVEVHWDATGRQVRITVINVETDQRLTTSILDLWDGLHNFPRTLTPPDMPEPRGMFSLSASKLKALMAAAVTAGHDVIDVHATHHRRILLRTDPWDIGPVTIYSTAALAPWKRHDQQDPDPGPEGAEADDSTRPRWLHSVPSDDDGEDQS